MAKFKVNDEVIVVATGQKGVVMCREEINDKETKRTNVTYLVKLGEGFDNYKVFTRKELQRVVRPVDAPEEVVRVFDAPNGVKVTMVAMTEVLKDETLSWENEVSPVLRTNKTKVFRMGVSFYNPNDEYDELMGYKIARHRAFEKPFCTLTARFLGEFNAYTVEALMEAKARYIVENIEHFVKK